MLKKGYHGYVIKIMVKTKITLNHSKSVSIKHTLKYVYKAALIKG